MFLYVVVVCCQRRSTRVIYFRNLPLRFFTDVEFIDLVKEFGTPVRYIMASHRQKVSVPPSPRRSRGVLLHGLGDWMTSLHLCVFQGFIEMSTSSEAQRAVKQLTSKPVIFNSSRLVIQISNKYKRLINGSESKTVSSLFLFTCLPDLCDRVPESL